MYKTDLLTTNNIKKKSEKSTLRLGITNTNKLLNKYTLLKIEK